MNINTTCTINQFKRMPILRSLKQNKVKNKEGPKKESSCTIIEINTCILVHLYLINKSKIKPLFLVTQRHINNTQENQNLIISLCSSCKETVSLCLFYRPYVESLISLLERQTLATSFRTEVVHL